MLPRRMKGLTFLEMNDTVELVSSYRGRGEVSATGREMDEFSARIDEAKRKGNQQIYP